MESQYNSVFEQELETRRKKLLKVLEQSQQIENLAMAPEWEFFIDWLHAVDDRITRDMKSGKFLNDHNGYIYAAAATDTLDVIFRGIEKFKRAFVTANKQLMQLNDQQKNG